MASSRDSKDQRFRKKDSARSGFTYKKNQLVRDEGVLVGPDDFDSPPPSEESLGGEGEISPGNTRTDYTDTETPAESQIPIKYVTAAGGISFTRHLYRAGEDIPASTFFYIVGSNVSIDITADKQVSAGNHRDQLTMECVGSSVTLEDGSGLSLRSIFTMDSGSLINLFYNATDSLWYETSRSRR